MSFIALQIPKNFLTRYSDSDKKNYLFKCIIKVFCVYFNKNIHKFDVISDK